MVNTNIYSYVPTATKQFAAIVLPELSAHICGTMVEYYCAILLAKLQSIEIQV
jgi:hypothetical protein